MRTQSSWRWWHLVGDYPPEDEKEGYPAFNRDEDGYPNPKEVVRWEKRFFYDGKHSHGDTYRLSRPRL